MSPLTHEQRVLNGRIGALKVHAAGRGTTAQARRAFDARFDRQVDPEGILEPAERARRAFHARQLYFARLAAKSAAVRRRKAAS